MEHDARSVIKAAFVVMNPVTGVGFNPSFYDESIPLCNNSSGNTMALIQMVPIPVTAVLY